MQHTDEIFAYLKNQGVDYADIRFVDAETETLVVQNGKVTSFNRSASDGFGIRVLWEGAWGFFGAHGDLELSRALSVADQALSIAKASARITKAKPVKLAPIAPFTDSWASPCRIDPFAVKPEEKISLLQEAHALMAKNPLVKSTQGSLEFYQEKTQFCSTEGVSYEQTLTESGGGIAANAVDGGQAQTRSYPQSYGGNIAQAGYEAVLNLNLLDSAEAVAEQAAELTQAPTCPSADMDLILDPSHLFIQIHESCGHAFELDRVQGAERGYFGGSFMPLDGLGKYQYGSPQCNITADATLAGAVGSFKYDAEGVPGQRFHLVENGVAVNYLASRETAAAIGLSQSNGTMRAEGWSQAPIIRMTNINLEPGDWSLDEMIRETKNGILMETAKSWSIDDQRWNFQMGAEVGWLIKDGSIEGMVKNPTYSGCTPQLWGSLDAVANKDEWRTVSITGCGKGEPTQNAHVGHASSPARFRNIKVGV